MWRSVLILASLASTQTSAETTQSIADGRPDHLIEALASMTSGEQELRLAEGGVYVLNRAHSRGLALPPIVGDVTIDGRGAELRAYFDGSTSLIRVAPNGRLKLRNLTLAGANHTVLVNLGVVELDNVRFEDNYATDAPAVIENQGRISARKTQITFNTGYGKRALAAIANYGGLELVESTLSGNDAFGNQWSGRQAAIVDNHGELVLTRVRVHTNGIEAESSVPAGVFINGPRGGLAICDSEIDPGYAQPFVIATGAKAVRIERSSLGPAQAIGTREAE